MKLFESHRIDERVRSNARYAAAILLGVTQVLLAGVIFFRLYVLGQPDAEIRDFQAVLGISIFGYIALQLFLGGIFPIPTLRGALIAYVALTGLVAGGCILIYGVPPIENWANTWLPAVAGPAILVGAYALLARLGKQRLEKQIGE
ncbi:MAG: hypothetical protein GF330_09105 [Candidatus Eisenbacteria bacterium]|nr:hypothetical protein [Candidatus Eisenbacteria bacterium]